MKRLIWLVPYSASVTALIWAVSTSAYDAGVSSIHQAPLPPCHWIVTKPNGGEPIGELFNSPPTFLPSRDWIGPKDAQTYEMTHGEGDGSDVFPCEMVL